MCMSLYQTVVSDLTLVARRKKIQASDSFWYVGHSKIRYTLSSSNEILILGWIYSIFFQVNNSLRYKGLVLVSGCCLSPFLLLNSFCLVHVIFEYDRDPQSPLGCCKVMSPCPEKQQAPYLAQHKTC